MTPAVERTDRSAARLRWIAAAWLLPLVVIAARLVHVQTVLPPRFEAAWTETTQRREPIAPRTGRLLAADGVVLADDIERHDLEVHYRWIEQPCDPVWLTRETLARLPRSHRRDPVRRAAARAEVLADRDRLHDDLRALLGPEAFDRRRAAIQSRVDRMRRVVLDRREQSATSATRPRGWAGWWDAISSELTQPPERTAGRFVLKEETDYHPLLTDAPVEVVGLIESAPRRFRGLRVGRHSRRRYPLGDTAAHVLGFRRVDGASEAATARGQAGLERSFDRTLSGQPGEAVLTLDWAGQEQSRRPMRNAVDGRDVTLTIHAGWQRQAEAALDEAIDTHQADGGVLLVVDCWSGAVRVAASGPRVDPNLYLRPDPVRWAKHQADPRRPFFPRISRMALPPGSTFKLLTAAAALESGLDANETFLCQGYRSRPDRERCAIFVARGVGHGELTLTAAIARSCNVVFYDLADRLGHPTLADWASRSGFGWTTGIELPGEAAGSVPQPPDRGRLPSGRRQLAIGQGELTATPLQVARLTAAIANGGRLIQPHLTDSTSDVGYSRLTRVQPWPGVSPSTLAVLRDGMVQAVAAPGGTAHRLAALPVPVAGKTGTAETEGRSHAWFTGYFPAGDPRYALVAVLEHGGSGGQAAAPLAGAAIEAIVSSDDWRDW